MNIQQHAALSAHSTMRLGGSAAYAADITSRPELTEALDWAKAQGLPVLMIGDGSNIVWKDDGFAGLLLINKIRHFDIYNEDETNSYVTIGAGENWDEAVYATVDDRLSGIEALSLIPGTAGATPVQNVGAYGQDIASVLSTVEVYDTMDKSFKNLQAFECGFGYRTSRFNTTDRGRFFITGITLHLSRHNMQPPFYRTIEEYLEQYSIKEFTPAIIRGAVVAIRSAKLPNPAYVANTGSFFANPIISSTAIIQLAADNPEMPQWPQEDGSVKIPAAWLIEQIGFKGVHDESTGMSTWHVQPLVLVNEHARNTADLLAFKQKIVTAVEQKFGITLRQEPELLPA